MTKPYLTYILPLIVIINVAISRGNPIQDAYVNNPIKDTISLRKISNYLEQLTSEKKSDSALIISEKVIKSAEEFGEYLIAGDAYVNRGETYSELNKYFKAIQSYKKAIRIFEKLEHLERLALVYKNLYFLEYYKGNLTEAAEYILESKTYYEKIDDQQGISTIFNYLGDVHAKLEDFKLSEEYYKKSISLKKQLNKEKGIGLTINNLSYLYINNKMPEKAKVIVKKALKINKDDNQVVYTIYSYYILAKIALHEKEYRTSEKYYDTVLNIGSRTKHFALVIPMIISKQQLGKIALETKHYSTPHF